MSKKRLIPLRPPDDLVEAMSNAPAEQQYNFQVQLTQLNIANALTALAINSGAMTPEGDFVYPEEEKAEKDVEQKPEV